MYILPITIYLLLCLLVAYRGRKTKIGYFGTLLLSILLTPVVVFIALLILTPSPKYVEVVYRHPGGNA